MGETEVAYLSVGERKGMGIEVPDQAIEGVRSLEVRWIFAGRAATAVAGWFGRFPAQTVTLEDAYLVDPYMPGLSVKIRAQRALEIKRYLGSPGLLEMPGRARGRLESWQKWSFPSAPASQGSADPAGWRTLRKRRRISRLPGCAVELTEFHALGEDWWTLGFEATGPADVLPGRLEAAAALVFSQAMPDGMELSIDDSMSFAQWLRSQLPY
jgi:hypothetical protein